MGCKHNLKTLIENKVDKTTTSDGLLQCTKCLKLFRWTINTCGHNVLDEIIVTEIKKKE